MEILEFPRSGGFFCWVGEHGPPALAAFRCAFAIRANACADLSTRSLNIVFSRDFLTNLLISSELSVRSFFEVPIN
jgi:hypothetical protein